MLSIEEALIISNIFFISFSLGPICLWQKYLQSLFNFFINTKIINEMLIIALLIIKKDKYNYMMPKENN